MPVTWPAAAALLFLGLMQTAWADSGDTRAPTATATIKPQPSAALLSPAGEGRRQFLRLNCYSCHGMHAGGGMGPNIVGAELGDLQEVISQGGELGMPPFHAYLTATQIGYIAAYLATIGTAKEPTFDHWWEAKPSR